MDDLLSAFDLNELDGVAFEFMKSLIVNGISADADAVARRAYQLAHAYFKEKARQDQGV